VNGNENFVIHVAHNSLKTNTVLNIIKSLEKAEEAKPFVVPKLYNSF